MKKVYTILLIFHFSITYGQSTKEQGAIENTLLQCLEESYEQEDVDIKRQLNLLESYLIKTNILASDKGTAYYKYFQNIAKHNQIAGTIDYKQFKDIYKLKPAEYYSPACIQGLIKLDTDTIKNSKFYQLTLKMQAIGHEGTTTPSAVAKAIISVLSPLDFDKPYYKAMALLTMANVSDPQTEQSNTSQSTLSTTGSKVVTTLVELTHKDETLLNGKMTSKADLQKQLKLFIQINKATHEILLKAERATSYKYYVTILDLISEVYKELRNEEAKGLFNRIYDELTDSEKEKINDIYPKRIKET